MPTLYYSPGACSLASHIVLEEIAKPYDTVLVDLRKGEHLKPEYIAINPHARVPTLKVGSFILTECPAILAYLDRSNPDAALMPEDPAAEAKGLSLMSWLSSSVHIAFAQVFRPARYSDDANHHPAIQASGRQAIAAHFAEIETGLGDAHYALGRKFSVVDPYLLVFYRWGLRIGLDMASFVNFSAHAQRMLTRNAVQRVFAKEGITLAA
jgi:glutathione S-transferase